MPHFIDKLAISETVSISVAAAVNVCDTNKNAWAIYKPRRCFDPREIVALFFRSLCAATAYYGKSGQQYGHAGHCRSRVDFGCSNYLTFTERS